MRTHSQSPSFLRHLPIIAILTLAFLVRVIGVNFGLPNLYHADEPIVVNHAMAYGAGDLNPHFFKIPPLVSYLLFGVYGLYFLGGRMLGFFRTPEDFENLFYADPTSFYLLARLIFGVVMGTFTVYLFYRLISAHFSQRNASLSAFLLGICFLHVRDSHYIYLDIPLVLVMVLGFFPILQIAFGNQGLGPHVVTGLMMGLATATKYNGMALVIPYLFACSFLPVKRRLLEGLILTGVAAGVVYLVLNLYSILDFNFFLQEIKTEARAHGNSGWLHHLRYSLAGGVGIPVLTAGLFGLVRALKALPFAGEKSCLAIFVLGYYLIISIAGQPYDRYALPLVPFLIFFAADFVIWLSESFKRQRKLLLAAGLLVMAAPNLAKSIFFDKVMSAEDTRTLAKDWVEKNISDGSKLALGWEFYLPRLTFSRAQLTEKKRELLRGGAHSKTRLRRVNYLLDHSSHSPATYDLFFLVDEPEKRPRFLFAKPTLPYDLSALQRMGIDYVVVARTQKNQKPAAFYEELAKRAKLVMEFNPYRDPAQKWPVDSQPLTGGPFLFRDLLLRERNGQIIQIYKLKNLRKRLTSLSLMPRNRLMRS